MASWQTGMNSALKSAALCLHPESVSFQQMIKPL